MSVKRKLNNRRKSGRSKKRRTSKSRNLKKKIKVLNKGINNCFNYGLNSYECNNTLSIVLPQTEIEKFKQILRHC